MKVLQINAVNGISSTGRTCAEITDYLNQNGHDAHIAYAGGTPADKGYFIGSTFDHKLHGLWSRVFGKQTYFSKRATKELVAYIQKLKPDVVHLRNLHSNFINLGILLKYLADHDVPTVITLHDCWFYTGKCTHYTVDSCYKWQNNCGGCPRLKKDNPSWFFDKTTQMLADKREWFGKIPRMAVVGVSDWITREALKSFLVKAKITQRIYNWIDTDVFSPVETTGIRKHLDLENKFVILGVASGWSNAKGLDKFLALVEILPADMQLVLVGTLPEKVILPENIKTIPATHSVNELVAFYAMADVYLHLSEEETFGKTIAEAMSCGTPAIVLNSTACPEVVGSDGGIVIDHYTPEAVLQAIEKIKETPELGWRKNASRRVKENFDKKTLMEEHIALYQAISS